MSAAYPTFRANKSRAQRNRSADGREGEKEGRISRELSILNNSRIFPQKKKKRKTENSTTTRDKASFFSSIVLIFVKHALREHVRRYIHDV